MLSRVRYFFRVKYDVGLNDFARELRQEARFPGRTLVLSMRRRPLVPTPTNIA